MSARLFYCTMELKRAWKRLPHICAGAIVLLFLMGTIAFLSSRLLYGDQATGRISVGVVVPEGDALSKQAMSMMSSLDSVKSICDFVYLEEEEALSQLESRQLYAVLKLPGQMIEGIIDGTNPPALIILPEGTGPESRIFKELADAGAGILSASQAGIYAGNELCVLYHTEDATSQLEADLNRLYLSYSLPRADYFKKIKVNATNDLDPLAFYAVSAFTFLLLLCSIPVSGYLKPAGPVIRQKLRLIGIGAGTVVVSRILGLAMLFLIISLPICLAASAAGWITLSLPSYAALFLVCAAAAAFSSLLFQAAGTLLGGVMLLFLVTVTMHFLAGGFLPLVFLPGPVRAAAPFLPSSILMEGLQMMVTAQWPAVPFVKLGVLTGICIMLSMLTEVKNHG